MRLEVVHESAYVHKVRLIVNEEPVSWLTIVDFPMRIGSSAVLMGGIAGVYTKKEHRMKGYASKVLRHAIKWMSERRYPLSALFGIPNFYHKFGYAVFMGEHTLSIMVRDLEGARMHYAIERLDEADQKTLRSVIDIYNENNRERSGTIVRDPSRWKGFPKGLRWDHKPLAYTVLRDDEVVGYFAYDPWQFGETLNVAEIGAREHDYKVYETMSAYLAREGVKGRYASITFYLPCDHPFTRFAMRYGYVMKSHYPRRAHGMARIIDLRALFEGLRPELERRLMRARGEYDMSVALETDIGSVTLKVRGCSVEVSEEEANYKLKMRQEALTQLILGYRDIGDLLYDEVKADTEALPLMDALFPRGVPYVWQPDRW